MTLEEGGGSDLKRVAEAASLIFCLWWSRRGGSSLVLQKQTLDEDLFL